MFSYQNDHSDKQVCYDIETPCDYCHGIYKLLSVLGGGYMQLCNYMFEASELTILPPFTLTNERRKEWTRTTTKKHRGKDRKKENNKSNFKSIELPKDTQHFLRLIYLHRTEPKHVFHFVNGSSQVFIAFTQLYNLLFHPFSIIVHAAAICCYFFFFHFDYFFFVQVM